MQSASNETVHGHSMGTLLVDHQMILLNTIIVSLVIGVPLAVNTLWHLQVSNNTSGRGVLR